MVHPGSQWLFILNDSTQRKANISAFADKLIEGENVAFIYNVTKFHDSCHVINYLFIDLVIMFKLLQ